MNTAVLPPKPPPISEAVTRELAGLDAQQRGADRADVVVALGAAPDLGLAIGGHRGEAGVGFDIALMGGGGVEGAFDHQIGLGKTGGQVAMAEFALVGHVLRHAGGHGFKAATGLHDGRAGCHGGVDIGDMGQLFVGDLDQLQRGLGGRGV